MKRSNRCVFVSHCMLNQAVMAEGLVRNEPAIIKQVLKFCMENDIGIVQMPCPETICDAGGLGRERRGKSWYEKNGLRQTSAKIAKEQTDYMSKLSSNGVEILAILGVEFSPSCAPNYLSKGRTIVRDKGIYHEELKRELQTRKLNIPFIGVNQRWKNKLERQLNEILQ
ncbi:MAG: hypothetical protein IID32_00770 [Planctomycetes bacterium]|nr:hypothetical protein [Planctomycetota bacterium]